MRSKILWRMISFNMASLQGTSMELYPPVAMNLSLLRDFSRGKLWNRTLCRWLKPVKLAARCSKTWKTPNGTNISKINGYLFYSPGIVQLTNRIHSQCLFYWTSGQRWMLWQTMMNMLSPGFCSREPSFMTCWLLDSLFQPWIRWNTETPRYACNVPDPIHPLILG